MNKFIGKLVPRTIGFYFNLASFFAPKRIAESAFLLFCTPRKGKVENGQRGFLEDAKDLILEEEVTKIQTYRWKGSGPTVLLMHGWESNSFRWRSFIPRLQKENYNIIAMDGPGHGNTSGNLLNLPLYSSCAQKVINRYNPTHVIGHSLGGMAILYNLYKYKTNNAAIEKVVTLGSPSELSDFMRQYKNILGLSNRMMGLLEDYFIKTFGFRFTDFSSSKFAKHITKKGLLIHDELDAVAPYWSSEQVHASWKGSKLVATKGLGHSLHQDKVRDEIIGFLKS
ncbi:alpha/beta hydrolase [Maribacter algarum]|uniref:Alpha/beta hydrolase n=2 Tax=Maribacter algarum (ex Zhang et al. 2020) TaxID=2578118 RepID=A0A5S3PX41_9FLAO|nr:alpha/beta hydrolase [Maribacter algarum]